jgi:heme-NO-binding protein
MHGTIFAELKKYVTTKFNEQAWEQLLNDSGIGPRIFLAFQNYPDEEALALVAAANQLTGIPVPALLEDFGDFIAPDLIAMYRHLIKPEWRTLDLIEHTEETIHHLVRLSTKGAQPPLLKCSRPNPDQVIITYTSPRKLCALAVGISKGLAKHYGETVDVFQRTCMLQYDPACELVVSYNKTLP